MTPPRDPSIVVIWKPKGPSSFRIVAEIRKITGQKKVGHAGTLDPLAEGILLIGIGREGTRQLGSLVKKEKEYEATIKFGETTTTDDAEGEKTTMPPIEPPVLKTVASVLQSFVGLINQEPPIYSALKIHGKPAYALARKGKITSLPTRVVEVKEIEIIQYAWPFLTIRVVTGPGVYIRSLARDIGRALKTGGYLSALTRTRVGQFTKDDIARDLIIPPADELNHKQENKKG